uniref:hypothetical protein n=1 Tax=Mammaliicoccus sp. P-M57 TaxID=2898716 RepID=UPI001EFAF954
RSLLIKRPPTFLILTILLFKEVVQLSVDGPVTIFTQVGRSVTKCIYIHTSGKKCKQEYLYLHKSREV